MNPEPDDYLLLPGEGNDTLLGPCACCGTLVSGDPDRMASVRIHPDTRCPLRPDGTQVQPGDPDGVRHPICVACAAAIFAHDGRTLDVRALFPRARTDLIRRPEQ